MVLKTGAQLQRLLKGSAFIAAEAAVTRASIWALVSGMVVAVVVVWVWFQGSRQKIIVLLIW
jgi:hypothetical protein